MWKNISKILGAVTAVSGLVGAIIFTGAYFVHADDYKKDQQAIVEQLRDSEKRGLEDQVFKIERIPAADRSMDDNAWLERYKRRMKELEKPQ